MAILWLSVLLCSVVWSDGALPQQENEEFEVVLTLEELLQGIIFKNTTTSEINYLNLKFLVYV